MTTKECREILVVVHQIIDHPEHTAAFCFDDAKQANDYMDYLISKGCQGGSLFKADLSQSPVRHFDYTHLPPPKIGA